jgi:hypothetical protein
MPLLNGIRLFLTLQHNRLSVGGAGFCKLQPKQLLQIASCITEPPANGD